MVRSLGTIRIRFLQKTEFHASVLVIVQLTLILFPSETEHSVEVKKVFYLYF